MKRPETILAAAALGLGAIHAVNLIRLRREGYVPRRDIMSNRLVKALAGDRMQ